MAGSRVLTDPHAAVPLPGPITWNVENQAWLASRYQDVQSVLRSGSIVSADPGRALARIDERTGHGHPHLAAVLKGTQLFQSGERHRETRATVRALAAATRRRWKPKNMRQTARAIVERAQTGVAVDVVPSLADALPNAIAADIQGLDEATVRTLRTCGQEVSAIWRLMPPLREYDRLEGVCARVHAVIAKALKGSAGSPLASASGDRLDYDIADQMFFLATAIADTTASAIAAALDLLASHPRLQEELRQSPARIGAFTDEVLRLAGPIRKLTGRISTAPIEVGGVRVAEGGAFILDIERAHRDPGVYPSPDRIDLSRNGAALLAFGGGAHACQGRALGRREVRIMIECILRRLRLEPAAEPGQLTGNPHLRQYANLPLVLHACH